MLSYAYYRLEMFGRKHGHKAVAKSHRIAILCISYTLLQENSTIDSKNSFPAKSHRNMHTNLQQEAVCEAIHAVQDFQNNINAKRAACRQLTLLDL